MTRAMVFTIIKQLVEKSGLKKGGFASYLQTFIRYTSFRERRRFKIDSNDAWARKYYDN